MLCDLAQPWPSAPHCSGSSILKQALCYRILPRAAGQHPKSSRSAPTTLGKGIGSKGNKKVLV